VKFTWPLLSRLLALRHANIRKQEEREREAREQRHAEDLARQMNRKWKRIKRRSPRSTRRRSRSRYTAARGEVHGVHGDGVDQDTRLQVPSSGQGAVTETVEDAQTGYFHPITSDLSPPPFNKTNPTSLGLATMEGLHERQERKGKEREPRLAEGNDEYEDSGIRVYTVERDARLDIPSAGQTTYAEGTEDDGIGHPKENTNE